MYVDKCTQKSMVDIRPQCAAGRKNLQSVKYPETSKTAAAVLPI